MYDLHAVSGSVTTIAPLTTIMLGGDKATTAGVPPHGSSPPATLVYHGAFGTLADTLLEYRLLNNDMSNNRQGFDFTANASSLIGSVNFRSSLKSQLQRQQSVAANTGTCVASAYTIDYYSGVPGSWIPTGDVWKDVICDSNTFATTTAVTWQDKAYIPTVSLDSGRYAILGAKVTALTTNPYALIRFGHNDFKGYHPGFVAYDQTQFALARAVVDNAAFVLFPEGMQFVAMGECPTFTSTADGTGLTLQAETTSAVTPVINVILKYLGKA